MKITCQNLREFYDTIAAMVERGLTFEAYTFDMTIELTGGY